MKNNPIQEKSFAFSLAIIQQYKRLTTEYKEYILSKQLLRSGTAIGALIQESQYAESKKDFIHKLAISLKEAHETEYWLELLNQSDYIERNDFEPLINSNKELVRILVSIIKKSKENL